MVGRHQIGAFIGTCVDFGTMILLVEALGAPPTAAAAVGATLGGVTNFILGRSWIFRSRSGAASWQAARYAMVSGCSAAWNALGEHIVHDLGHVRYLVARAFVAFAVGVLWNFPMHRRFVFR